MYQLPREFGSFNGLAVLCISVDCVRLGVLWRFSSVFPDSLDKNMHNDTD